MYICKVIEKLNKLEKITIIFNYVSDYLHHILPLLLKIENVIFNIKIENKEIFENEDFINFIIQINDNINKISYQCDIDEITDNMKKLLKKLNVIKYILKIMTVKNFMNY